MGRGQVGFSGRHNLENKRNHHTVAAKDYSRRFRSFAPGKLKIQTKSANTSILCHGFKQKTLFSLLSTPHHGSFRGRALRYRLGLLHSSHFQGGSGDNAL